MPDLRVMETSEFLRTRKSDRKSGEDMLKKRLLGALLAVGILISGCALRPAGSPAAVTGMPAMTPSPTQTLPPVLIPVPPTSTPPRNPTATPFELPVSCASTPVVRAHPGRIPGKKYAGPIHRPACNRGRRRARCGQLPPSGNRPGRSPAQPEPGCLALPAQGQFQPGPGLPGLL